MKTANIAGLLFLVTGVLVGCSQSNSSYSGNTLEPNTKLSGIINGTQVLSAEALSKHVVAIYRADGAICTGTIISENLIITAAHCVKNTYEKNLAVVFDLNYQSVVNSEDQSFIDDKVRRVDAYIYHEDFDDNRDITFNKGKDKHERHRPDGIPGANSDKGSNDIALIKISGVIPPGYEPIDILPSDDYVDLGSEVTLYGYGISGFNYEQLKDPSEYSVDQLAQMGAKCTSDRLDCIVPKSILDGQLRTTTTTIYNFSLNEFYLEERVRGTCSGDSGGPGFVVHAGRNYLYGVTSRGSKFCNDDGIYADLTTFKGWISEAATKLGVSF